MRTPVPRQQTTFKALKRASLDAQMYFIKRPKLTGVLSVICVLFFLMAFSRKAEEETSTTTSKKDPKCNKIERQNCLPPGMTDNEYKLFSK